MMFASADLAVPVPRVTRMAAFLLLSLLLHLVWLMVPLPDRAIRNDRQAAPPLAVHLTRIPEAASAPPAARLTANPGPTRHRDAGQSRTTAMPPHPAIGLAEPAPATSAERPHPAVDVGQALATARAAAREWRAAPGAMVPMPPPALPITVETAIARAARSDVVVESRGAAGEWVTRRGDRRCVTPVQVPFYLAGKSMLTQCDAWKG